MRASVLGLAVALAAVGLTGLPKGQAGVKEPELTLQTGHSCFFGLSLAIPDRGPLVSADPLGTILVWDPDSGTILRQFQVGPDGSEPTLVAVDPDGTTVAIGRGGQLQLRRLTDARLLWSASHEDRLVDLVFSPDGLWIAVGGRDQVTVRNTTAGDLDFEIAVPPGAILKDLAFSPDGAEVVLLTRAGLIIWPFLMGGPLRSMDLELGPGPKRPSVPPDMCVLFAPNEWRWVSLPDAGTAWVGSSYNRLTRVNLRDGHAVVISDDRSSRIRSMNRWAAVERRDGVYMEREDGGADDGWLVAKGEDPRLSQVVASADGSRVALMDFGANVWVVKPEERSQVSFPMNRLDSIGSLATIASTGEIVVQGGGFRRRVDLAGEGVTVSTAVDDASWLRASPDGEWVATVDTGRLTLWGPPRATRRFVLARGSEGDFGDSASMAFQPDGSGFAALVRGSLRFWDLTSGEPLEKKPWSGAEGNLVAFAPDGNRVALVTDREIVFMGKEDGTVFQRTTHYRWMTNGARWSQLEYLKSGEVILAGGGRLVLLDPNRADYAPRLFDICPKDRRIFIDSFAVDSAQTRVAVLASGSSFKLAIVDLEDGAVSRPWGDPAVGDGLPRFGSAGGRIVWGRGDRWLMVGVGGFVHFLDPTLRRRPLRLLLSGRRDWLLLDSGGHFDGSPGAIERFVAFPGAKPGKEREWLLRRHHDASLRLRIQR